MRSSFTGPEMSQTRTVLSPEPATRIRLKESMDILQISALCAPTSIQRMGSLGGANALSHTPWPNPRM